MQHFTITYYSDMLLPEHVARLNAAHQKLKATTYWSRRLRREAAPPDAITAFNATVFQIQADAEIALSGGFIDG